MEMAASLKCLTTACPTVRTGGPPTEKKEVALITYIRKSWKVLLRGLGSEHAFRGEVSFSETFEMSDSPDLTFLCLKYMFFNVSEQDF